MQGADRTDPARRFADAFEDSRPADDRSGSAASRVERTTRREFLRLAAAAGFLAGPGARWLSSAVRKSSVEGIVQTGERPLAGVRVSDGRRVVRSDADGRFSLEVGPDSGPFLFVTTPPGYWTDLFHVPTAQAAEEGKVDFSLEKRAQPSSFRFVFWTDMHLEGGGVRLAKFRRTVAETRSLDPAFVWAQGDICLQGDAGKDYVACVADLNVPLRNGPGNHEMMVKKSDPREDFHELFGPTYYSFDWAGVHCVVLDGNQVVSTDDHWSSVHGNLSERELAWLEADLAAKPAGVPVVVGIHIPLVTTYSERRGGRDGPSPPWIVANAKEVHELLTKYDGRLVLQGHLHENERTMVDGIEYVASQAVAGSWWQRGEGFERGVDKSPRGYRIVTVDGREIRHRFHSSVESHVDSPGDFSRPGERVRPRGKTCFVFNCYDAPDEARSKGRVDGGAWRDMPEYPEVNHSLHLIMPHHYLLEVDTTVLEPGRHAIDVETTVPTAVGAETFRHRHEFTVVEESRPEQRKVPVVYSTDLYHPHDDPDDHFDLATLFAMSDIDLRAIILDDGVKQRKKPGIIPVRQLLSITGRDIPTATGLGPKLDSLRDTGKGQPKELQAGVELILRTLRKSSEPVTVVTVGSLRDLAAAYNREPVLCSETIDRIFAFIGDAHSAEGFEFREYNVNLDLNAFRCILESGLPVYWVPCFDEGLKKSGPRASLWRASHADLLRDVQVSVKQYFTYALLRKKREDPIAFLREPVDPAEWNQVLSMTRNLWCCAVFSALSGRKIVERDGSWHSAPAGQPVQGTPVEPFRFERVLVTVDDTGMTLYPEGLPRYSVERFRVTDPESYPRVMTAVTAELLAGLGKAP